MLASRYDVGSKYDRRRIIDEVSRGIDSVNEKKSRYTNMRGSGLTISSGSFNECIHYGRRYRNAVRLRPLCVRGRVFNESLTDFFAFFDDVPSCRIGSHDSSQFFCWIGNNDDGRELARCEELGVSIIMHDGLTIDNLRL
ncbi:hypothetical protein IEQ34_020279 [Dendrobium chrysotoxum]|uniref:Uncharacterized protein n=1 Tax=Dendrobium chrysotoxum TaxID=161865 RepID=A0AAV7G1M1_DENCH|nr:hypothetical protein IEQ34_020279 [Dendrobium chrysotoxum]